jgi:general L-amino acid transport system substrate-binding protein
MVSIIARTPCVAQRGHRRGKYFDVLLNFLGADGFDPGLNLSPTFAIDVVTQVGNYQEIYLEHIEPLGLTLEGSVNDLWSNGGLMYVPPYR